MYHGVTFKMYPNGGRRDTIVNTYKTYEDWHLIPTERPAIASPEIKTHTIDIPGNNGQLDLTEYLTGFPLYSNRSGSIEFAVDNRYYLTWRGVGYEPWALLHQNIMSALHGKRGQLILDDDPDWYYEGRFAVSEWSSGDNYSTIIIDYDLEPFKTANRMSNEPWLWDPFDFVEGVIPDVYNNIVMSLDPEHINFPEVTIYNSGPPTNFSVSNSGNACHLDLYARDYNGNSPKSSFTLENGLNSLPGMVLSPGDNRLVFSEGLSNTLEISFRRRSL